MYRADLLMRCGSQGSRINKVPQPMGVYNLRRRQCYIMFFRDRWTNIDQLTFCRNYSSNCTVLGSTKWWMLWSGDLFFDLQLSFHMIFTGFHMYPKADVQNMFHPIPLTTVGETASHIHQPASLNTSQHRHASADSWWLAFFHSSTIKKMLGPPKSTSNKPFLFHSQKPARQWKPKLVTSKAQLVAVHSDSIGPLDAMQSCGRQGQAEPPRSIHMEVRVQRCCQVLG